MLPEIKSWSSREVVTNTRMNEQVRDVYLHLTNPPWAMCTRTNPLPITGGTIQSLPWETAVGSGFTVNRSGANVVSLGVQHKGTYRVGISLAGKVSDVGYIYAYVYVNGTMVMRGVTSAEDASLTDTAYTEGLLQLAPGDLVTTNLFVSSNRTAMFTDGEWETRCTRLFLQWFGDA